MAVEAEKKNGQEAQAQPRVLEFKPTTLSIPTTTLDEGEELLSFGDIGNASDVKSVIVAVPEWPNPKTGKPGKVKLQSMSAADAFAFSSESDETRQRYSSSLRMLSYCLVRADGSRMYLPEQLDVLARKNSAVVMRLAAYATQLNRMDIDEVSAAKKDSSDTEAGASPSVSQ